MKPVEPRAQRDTLIRKSPRFVEKVQPLKDQILIFRPWPWLGLLTPSARAQ